MSNEGSTWPEQEVVVAWLLKHGLDVPLEARLELQARLTALRVKLTDRASVLEAAVRVCERLMVEDLKRGRLQAKSIIQRCVVAIRALKASPSSKQSDAEDTAERYPDGGWHD